MLKKVLLTCAVAIFIISMASCGNKKVATLPPVDETPSTTTALPDIPDVSTSVITLSMSAPEKVTLTTSDGVTIAGDFSMPEKATKAVVLLHMMPATRSSYAALSESLNKVGIATLAIDLRGHGESTSQGDKKINYESFSDKEHQASRLDVDSALEFLKKKGFSEDKIAFVGASIGANLSLDALERYKDTLGAVLLSPGLTYRGVGTEKPLKSLSTEQKVWLVTAEGDQYSNESVLKLQQTRPDIATMSILSGKDHGTTLLGSQPTLISDITKFISSL